MGDVQDVETQKFREVPLGRTRVPSSPDDDLSRRRKIAITTFLILCNSVLVGSLDLIAAWWLIVMQFFSFGAGLAGAFEIGKLFGVYDPTTAIWIPASYP